MAPNLKPQAFEALKKIVDDAVSDTETGIPGLSVAITNTNGDDLFTYANGYTDVTKKTKLNEDNIFWIASTTKLIATAALLQLVEQGKLQLDDADQVESLVPELKKLPIATLNDDGSITLKPKKNRITLRHLLSHTAGFGYSFFNDTLARYANWYDIDEFDVSTEREIQFPLLFEPGTNWHYGVGVDWAGVVLERFTGQKLGDYIDENIIKPLGIKDTTFHVDDELRKKLVDISFRDKTGKFEKIQHTYRKFFEDPKNEKFHSAGAGLVSRPNEYIKFLATLLNDGTSPQNGAQILKPETVKLVFENQIPNLPNFARVGIPASNPKYTNPLPELYPQEGNPPQGWSLSLFLTLEKGATGRAPGTGFWAGIVNLYYWIDKETGVAGYIASQILPFADPKVQGAWVDIETEVYKNLEV